MKSTKREISLKGITPIMFDRYSGSNDDVLPVMQKAYYSSNGRLVIPAINIMSFLSAF